MRLGHCHHKRVAGDTTSSPGSGSSPSCVPVTAFKQAELAILGNTEQVAVIVGELDLGHCQAVPGQVLYLLACARVPEPDAGMGFDTGLWIHVSTEHQHTSSTRAVGGGRTLQAEARRLPA